MAILTIDDITPSVEARFWGYVDKRGPDDCWEWRAYRSKRGYGFLGLTTINGKAVSKATHISLLIDGRERPSAAYSALHSCDNPPCCNPAHLRWGTQTENVLEAASRGRMRCVRGTENHKTKLTEDIVLKIRAETGGCVAVSKIYGISPSHVNNIRKRRVWAYI